MARHKIIPRILKINDIKDYQVSLLFSNGESRIIDFIFFFREVLKKRKGDLGYELIENKTLFDKIKIIGTTIGWEEIGTRTNNLNGEEEFYPYDLDPEMLYLNSDPDTHRSTIFSMKIKTERLAAGLTKAQLAKKSGVSEYDVSKIESHKTDIDFSILKKVVENGLGKTLTIHIR